MILARLTLGNSFRARQWASNPYRVHQRLRMAFPAEGRLLFRIEPPAGSVRNTTVLVQTDTDPEWDAAFGEFPVLAGPPEWKAWSPSPQEGGVYRFRLLANPTVCRDGKRQGLLHEEDQQAWLSRKLAAAGAVPRGVQAIDLGLQRSWKRDGLYQVHQAVRFDGVLEVGSAELLRTAVEQGVGPAKGYGFGLLSLAAAR